MKFYLTSGGNVYCEDCYGDLKCPFDSDFTTMWKEREVKEGTCECCDAVCAGNVVDTPASER